MKELSLGLAYAFWEMYSQLDEYYYGMYLSLGHRDSLALSRRCNHLTHDMCCASGTYFDREELHTKLDL